MRCKDCGTELAPLQLVCLKCSVRSVGKSETPTATLTQSNEAPVVYPRTLDEFVGQRNVKMRLAAICEFCRNIGEAAEHFLIVGPEGMGKRTIARAFAVELNVTVVEFDAATFEWMKKKAANLSESYEALKPDDSHSPFKQWFDEMLELRAEPDRYNHIDAAQLIKHAFGLLRHFKMRNAVLVYLYWEPRNRDKWPQCEEHRKEAEALASKVRASCVKLSPISYRELWSQGLFFSADHMTYVMTRYDLAV
jgi:hypothetical protein